MKEIYEKNKVFIKMYDYKNLNNVEKRALNNKVQSLYKRNKIKKIKNGLYTMTNPINDSVYVNKYEIGTAMFSKAYIGYHTALEYYGLNNQMSREVQVMVEKPEREVEFENVKYKFYIGDGKSVIEKENYAKIYITSLEKTIFDCVNNIKYAGGLEELYKAVECIKYIDENKLLKILEYYNNDKVYQKIGWLFYVANKNVLSNKFYQICKSKVKVMVDLRENKKNSSKFFKEWNIIAPKYLFWEGI